MTEQDIQNAIRLKLTEMGFFTERINVGEGYLISKSMRDEIMRVYPAIAKAKYFKTGAVKGRSDLSAIRDGQIAFLEVKTPTGRVSDDQQNFIEQMQAKGCVAGVVRSVDDAISLISPVRR